MKFLLNQEFMEFQNSDKLNYYLAYECPICYAKLIVGNFENCPICNTKITIEENKLIPIYKSNSK